MEQYRQLRAAAARRVTAADAPAPVRVEGTAPSDAGTPGFDAGATGRMTPAEAVVQALAPYRR
ncbi:hypothetical protein WIS52_07105 [Pseudonocardia nematodicida]|uniref:Uncharacterized protein n=1 Tax=Pseudonocardia nematodicida TaxID=1206997 RepID=A0ABV1K8N3_9PSEU